jgi:hypothetical protein
MQGERFFIPCPEIRARARVRARNPRKTFSNKLNKIVLKLINYY